MNYLDKIKIKSNFVLSVIDMQVLTLLYLPIISSKAYTLYNAFFNLLDRSKLEFEMPTKTILDLTKIKLEDFIKHREVLEGIGLIKTYRNENSYLIEIRTPLSPSAFLKDSLLGSLLMSSLGENEFKRLSNYFKIAENKEEYHEISKTFAQVFQIQLAKENLKDKYINRNNTAYVNFVSMFDFELFLNQVGTNFISKKMLTDNLKDTIAKLAFSFNFNESDMRTIYLRSLNSNLEFNPKQLEIEAKKFYQQKHGTGKVKISFNENKKDELINYLVRNSPKEILESTSKVKLTAADLEIIYRLQKNYRILPEVISVMIFYVLNLQKGRMPGYNYFEKIANEWVRNGIETAADALNYINKNAKTRSRPKAVKQIKPKWQQEYEEDTSKKNTELVIEEVTDLVHDELKEFFSEENDDEKNE